MVDSYSILIHLWIDVLIFIFWDNCFVKERNLFFMNIHEECLINYLQKPDELSHTTDVLKLNNALLAKKIKTKLFLAKNTRLNYTNKDD